MYFMTPIIDGAFTIRCAEMPRFFPHLDKGHRYVPKGPQVVRAMKMMEEAAMAQRLFRRPSAFYFRPSWSKARGDTRYLRRLTRHKRVVAETAASRRLFSNPSAFRFRPKWRGVKRKRVQRKRVGTNSAKRRRFRFA